MKVQRNAASSTTPAARPASASAESSQMAAYTSLLTAVSKSVDAFMQDNTSSSKRSGSLADTHGDLFTDSSSDDKKP